jgi:hypothetical protein
MAVTRTQIRQEAAARLGALVYPYPSTAASGSASTAVVSELIDSVDSQYAHIGSWAYFLNGTNAGSVRRVQSYAPDTGTLTFNRALAASIAASDTFELHEWFDPRIWHDCLSRALRNTMRERREALAIVDNQTEYPLSSFTWITKKSQIHRLILRHGATAGQYRYAEVPRWRWHIEADDDAFTLVLTQAFTGTASLALYFDAIGPYDDLSTDASSTTCDLDYIVFGALKQAYDVYGKLIEDGAKKPVLIDRDEVLRKHQQLTREFGPKLNPTLRLAPAGNI